MVNRHTNIVCRAPNTIFEFRQLIPNKIVQFELISEILSLVLTVVSDHVRMWIAFLFMNSHPIHEIMLRFPYWNTQATNWSHVLSVVSDHVSMRIAGFTPSFWNYVESSVQVYWNNQLEPCSFYNSGPCGVVDHVCLRVTGSTNSQPHPTLVPLTLQSPPLLP